MSDTMTEVVCGACGATFAARAVEVRRGGGRFCSRSCANRARGRPLAESFWEQVAKGAGCWLWTGTCTPNGYGKFGSGLARWGTQYAHRVAYELHKGPIPEGLQIDHLCRNRRCVNPAHLEPVTQAVNLRRGRLARGLPR